MINQSFDSDQLVRPHPAMDHFVEGFYQPTPTPIPTTRNACQCPSYPLNIPRPVFFVKSLASSRLLELEIREIDLGSDRHAIWRSLLKAAV